MNNISKNAFVTLVTIWLVMVGTNAKALSMEFRPADQSVTLGDTATVDLWILDSNPALGLGSYDLTINFDSSILSFSSVSLNTVFGVTLGPFITPTLGAINTADVSLELPADLLSLQTANDFMLGEFQFNTFAAGSSLLSISGVTLGDAFGNSVATSVLDTGNIVVSAVPEPATWLLFIMGMLFLAGIEVQKRKKLA